MLRLFVVLVWVGLPGGHVSAEGRASVSVDLWNGSRLVGTTGEREFAFTRVDGRRVTLRTDDVVEIEADDDRELFTVRLADSEVRGDVYFDVLPVSGVFGDVVLPFTEVSRVRFVRPDLGLLVHLPFDGDCRDHSGNGNHGRRHDDVSFREGRLGRAAWFDGDGDYVSIEPRTEVSAIGDFSVSAWVHVDAWKTQTGFATDRQYVFDSGSLPTGAGSYVNGFALMCDRGRFGRTSESVESYLSVDGRNYEGYEIEVPLSRRWRLLTFTRRGDVESTYVDGSLVAAQRTMVRGSTNRALDIGHGWYVGTFCANARWPTNRGFRYDFRGGIDDLRVYRRALHDLEVSALSAK